MTQESPERDPRACPECHAIGDDNGAGRRVRYCENDDCRILAYREAQYVE